MKTIVNIVGTLVCALAAYSIPILLTCSLLLNWGSLYTVILLLITAWELVEMCILIFSKIEGEK